MNTRGYCIFLLPFPAPITITKSFSHFSEIPFCFPNLLPSHVLPLSLPPNQDVRVLVEPALVVGCHKKSCTPFHRAAAAQF